MILILDILQIILTVIWWIIIVQAILSWLIAFNVITVHNEYVGAIWRAAGRWPARIGRSPTRPHATWVRVVHSPPLKNSSLCEAGPM